MKTIGNVIGRRIAASVLGLVVATSGYSLCSGATGWTAGDPTLWCVANSGGGGGHVVQGNCDSWCCPGDPAFGGGERVDPSSCTNGTPYFVGGNYVSCDPATYGYTIDPTRPHLVCPSTVAQ